MECDPIALQVPTIIDTEFLELCCLCAVFRINDTLEVALNACKIRSLRDVIKLGAVVCGVLEKSKMTYCGNR